MVRSIQPTPSHYLIDLLNPCLQAEDWSLLWLTSRYVSSSFLYFNILPMIIPACWNCIYLKVLYQISSFHNPSPEYNSLSNRLLPLHSKNTHSVLFEYVIWHPFFLFLLKDSEVFLLWSKWLTCFVLPFSIFPEWGVKVTQSCPTLWPLWQYSPWNSPGQNTGAGSLSLLQGIFPTQGSNLDLLHCRWILYQLSH